jgi:hypothetical protein
MQRYRITKSEGGSAEETWVLLPDEPSAVMQAEELNQREKSLHVRVYRETVGDGGAVETNDLIRDLPAKRPVTV